MLDKSLMNILFDTIKKNAFPIGLILILAFARLIPHPPNFTPVIAVAILSGIFFKNIYLSLGILLVSMLLADAFIGFYNNIIDDSKFVKNMINNYDGFLSLKIINAIYKSSLKSREIYLYENLKSKLGFN